MVDYNSMLTENKWQNLSFQTSNIPLRSMPYTRNKFRNLACEEDCPKDLEFDGFFKEKIQTSHKKTHRP